MKNLYFIRDCNDTIVGNTKGYPTFKGANTQANKAGSKAYLEIWGAFDKARSTNPDQCHIHSIRLFGAV